MAVVTIFTKADCPDSQEVRSDLTSCQIPFEEIELEPSEPNQVPEIYFDNNPILGGVDELLKILQKWEVVTGDDGLPNLVPVKSGQSEIDQYYHADDSLRHSSSPPNKKSIRSNTRGQQRQQYDQGNNPAYDAHQQQGSPSRQDHDDSYHQREEAYREDSHHYREEKRGGSRNYYDEDGHSSSYDQRGRVSAHSLASSPYDRHTNMDPQQRSHDRRGHTTSKSPVRDPQRSSHARRRHTSTSRSPMRNPSQNQRSQYQGQQNPHNHNSRDHYREQRGQQQNNGYQQQDQSYGNSYHEAPFNRQQQHQQQHQESHQRDPYRQQPRGQHQEHYHPPTSRQQQSRDSLPATNSRGAAHFLQRSNKRDGLKGDKYQRHSFHGRTLYQEVEADDVTVTSPHDDDSSISSRQSSVQRIESTTKSRKAKFNASFCTSRPHSFHGNDLRRKEMQREQSFHKRTPSRQRDVEVNDEASVSNPNDDDSSICSRRSTSSSSQQSFANTSPQSATNMRREVVNLRKEMKREVSMRSACSLHGSAASLYGSLNDLSDESDTYTNDFDSQHNRSLREGEDEFFLHQSQGTIDGSTRENGHHSQLLEESFSLSPEELHSDFENLALSPAPATQPRPNLARASSVKHVTRKIEQDFMKGLKNSKSVSNLNYNRSASNLNYNGSRSDNVDGQASLRSIRGEFRKKSNGSQSSNGFDGQASLRSVRGDLRNVRSQSPASATGGDRATAMKRSNSAASNSAQNSPVRPPAAMMRQPSLRTSGMRIAAGRESFNGSNTSMFSNTPGRKEEYQHVVELPKGRTLSITEATMELLSIIPRGNLKYNLTTYQKSFSGTVGTDTLKEVYSLSREDAEDLGKTLCQAKLLNHVCYDHGFEDTGKFFYRLQCEQTPEILNSFALWQDEKTLTKQSIEVMMNIQEKLQTLLDQITDHTKGRIHYSHAAQEHEMLMADLDYAICELQFIHLARMDKNCLMAFGLNVYQVFLHYAFIKVGIPGSSSAQTSFWTELKFIVGGKKYSLSEWFNGICRANRKGPYGPPPFKGTDPRKFLSLPKPLDPRIHFAAGMTNFMRPLFFYSGQNLDVELEHAAKAYCRKKKLVCLETATTTLYLPGAFQAYSSDFAENGKGLPKVFMKWLPGKHKLRIDEALTIGKKVKVVFNPKGKCDDWNDYAGDYVMFTKAPFADFKKLLSAMKAKPEVKREIKRRGSLRNLFALAGAVDDDNNNEEKE